MTCHFSRIVLVCLLPLSGFAQSSRISDAQMQRIYEEVKTPFKYGLIMTPADNSLKMDCPTVFRKGKKWYMTYLIYGGRGYETWLATSNDLLNWKTMGRIMSFSDTTQWDGNQKAAYNALQDYEWDGRYGLNKYKGNYWMSYIGGAAQGYEAGDLSIGIAYTAKDPTIVHEWKRASTPVLTAKDADVRWWENRKLFKSSVIQDLNLLTGHPFVMYYNANGDTTGVNKTRWFERIGMAVSDDMLHWQRYRKAPVLMHSAGITGDAVIQKIDDLYVMFYFGAFWEDRKGAFNRFAASTDLVNWTDWTGANLIEPSESYDDLYAHKSFVLKHKGVVYHFYCAVNKADQRGIAVATSVDLGKSTKRFVAAPATKKP
ncbi:glycosylase [Spirosoma sp. KCTC 42546]|uniref:glycosylase n=1 Tax=Spirosoma sp. KCTC 42546 TaxID=2520506 RepID=UPI00115B2E64|nr:glycosylase [Spirosoma sp. KCTC 42546]QDK80644.1 glycosylase [Spirosoma sp. KCTC 42546]